MYVPEHWGARRIVESATIGEVPIQLLDLPSRDGADAPELLTVHLYRDDPSLGQDGNLGALNRGFRASIRYQCGAVSDVLTCDWDQTIALPCTALTVSAEAWRPNTLLPFAYEVETLGVMVGRGVARSVRAPRLTEAVVPLVPASNLGLIPPTRARRVRFFMTEQLYPGSGDVTQALPATADDFARVSLTFQSGGGVSFSTYLSERRALEGFEIPPGTTAISVVAAGVLTQPLAFMAQWEFG